MGGQRNEKGKLPKNIVPPPTNPSNLPGLKANLQAIKSAKEIMNLQSREYILQLQNL